MSQQISDALGKLDLMITNAAGGAGGAAAPLATAAAAAQPSGSIRQQLAGAFQAGIDAAFPSMAGEPVVVTVGGRGESGGGWGRPAGLGCLAMRLRGAAGLRGVLPPSSPLLPSPLFRSLFSTHPHASPAPTHPPWAALHQPQVWRLPVQQRHGPARQDEGAGGQASVGGVAGWLAGWVVG